MGPHGTNSASSDSADGSSPAPSVFASSMGRYWEDVAPANGTAAQEPPLQSASIQEWRPSHPPGSSDAPAPAHAREDFLVRRSQSVTHQSGEWEASEPVVQPSNGTQGGAAPTLPRTRSWSIFKWGKASATPRRPNFSSSERAAPREAAPALEPPVNGDSPSDPVPNGRAQSGAHTAAPRDHSAAAAAAAAMRPPPGAEGGATRARLRPSSAPPSTSVSEHGERHATAQPGEDGFAGGAAAGGAGAKGKPGRAPAKGSDAGKAPPRPEATGSGSGRFAGFFGKGRPASAKAAKAGEPDSRGECQSWVRHPGGGSSSLCTRHRLYG